MKHCVEKSSPPSKRTNKEPHQTGLLIISG
jgi:hypothetical protein